MDIDYNALEKKELKEKLLGLKDKCDISEPEYKALCLRLGIGYREHTYIEIAKIMNTSKQRVQQLYILFDPLFIILIILDHRTLLDG